MHNIVLHISIYLFPWLRVLCDLSAFSNARKHAILAVAYLGFHFGGGSKFFWKSGVFAWREAPCSAWRSHAFARGVRGHAPPRNFFKMVQFGAF